MAQKRGGCMVLQKAETCYQSQICKIKYTINMIKCNNRVNEVENLFEWMLLSSMLLHKIKFNVICLIYLMT